MTIASRMRRTLAAIKEQLRRRRHDALGKTGRWLASVVRGWHGYYGVLTTSTAWNSSIRRWRSSGVANFNVAASGAGPAGRGRGWIAWCASTFPVRVSSIPSQRPISRPTQSRSRMREYFTYGSVRGAAGNGGPYRDPGPGLRMLKMLL